MARKVDFDPFKIHFTRNQSEEGEELGVRVRKVDLSLFGGKNPIGPSFKNITNLVLVEINEVANENKNVKEVGSTTRS